MQGNLGFVILSQNNQPPGFVEYLLELFCTKKKNGFIEIDFSKNKKIISVLLIAV